MAASFPIAGRTPMLGPLPSKPTELPPEVARAFVRDIIGAGIASRTGSGPTSRTIRAEGIHPK